MPVKTSRGKFLYFAYGSNLLAQRIHLNNPTAVRAGIAKLNDYEIDFVTYSRRWRGASATIVPKKDSHVWGALWEINVEHMDRLDNQEGVQDNLYIPITVEVESPLGEKVQCRSYRQTAETPNLPRIEALPDDRRPSVVYLNTILKGAEESELPTEYQAFLRRIPHNGYDGNVDIGIDLSLQ